MCLPADVSPSLRTGRSETSWFHYRLLADSWTLYDNTTAVPRIIAYEECGKLQIGEAKTV